MTLGDTGNVAGHGGEDERLKQYKNVAKHEDMRRRRTECSVEIRKQKRDDMMMKRRQVVDDDESDDALTTDHDVSADNTEAKAAAAAARQPLMSFQQVVAVLSNNPSVEDMQRCFESVRRTLSRSKAPPIDETIENGVLNALVQALGVEDDKVRFESAWSITNIVSGTSRQTLAAVQAGAIAPLIHLMVSPNLQLAEQCLWAVANIAGDSSQMRDLVLQHNGLQALMYLATIMDRLEVSFVRTIAWSFSNMCRHKNPNASLEVLRELAKGLSFLLQHTDKAVRQDACWAVSYLTDGPDEQIQLAVDATLRVLGNMATGNDQLTQHVIDIGTLQLISDLIQRSKSTTIVKECCWLISNVIAGTQDQIQHVIDAGLLPHIFQVLDTGDFKCQFEASWAIANLAQGGTSQQIFHLWSDGAVGPMCRALKIRNTDILVNVLDSFYALLTNVCTVEAGQLDLLRELIEEHSGLDNLEGLQENESEKIYSLAYKIIHEFFSEDEDYPNESHNDENQPYAF
ncbi:unnamed protein product, partial [Mesorhabditis belari]|uniref:Importin subunit alpha n=1 Tax=Mesorhabditis belari TaxID=2138241 RepID=A0AAF3J2R3_9BILA